MEQNSRPENDVMTTETSMTAATLERSQEQGGCSAPSGGYAPSNVHFMSQTEEWPTPQKFFEAVNAELGPLELDVCATPENAKCPRYYTKADDGLKQTWTGKCWMNPPYGRVIGEWMRKAYESAQAGAMVVCLVPARTDTAWWHDYAAKGEVRFIRGRLKFGDGKNSAPFPSALVILKTHNYQAQRRREVNSGTPFAEARGWVKSAAQKPSALGNVPKVENRAGCSEVPGQHRASAEVKTSRPPTSPNP
jgi:phage N-6-adenine-methyltransferase